MKKALILLVVMCYFVAGVSPALAMPDTKDAMLIQNFDDFFNISEVERDLFGGGLVSQKDMEGHIELTDEYYANGEQAIKIWGNHVPLDDGKIYGMLSFTMNVPGTSNDWRGADYIQFYFANKTNIEIGVRLEIVDALGKSHQMPVDKGYITYREERPFEDIYVESDINSDKRVRLPAGFEGFVRVPLSLYTTLTDLSAIQKVYCGMNMQDAEGLPIYFDDFSVIKEGYKNPLAIKYPPELENPWLRIDQQNSKLIYTANVRSSNARDTIEMTAFDPRGKSIGTQKFDVTASDSYLRAEYIMPEGLSEGQYKMIINIVDGDENLKNEFYFPWYDMTPTTYSDVWNTKYEQAVALLSQMGIVTGYEDNTFRPEKTITRAEFAALIVRILGKEAEAKARSEAPFNDTAGHWSAGNIAVGVQAGIINGYGDGNFGPDDTVTFEQAMKMVVAALGYNDDAAAEGGYPDGFLKVGRNIGLYRNVTEEVPTAIRGTVAIMLRNAIAVPIKGEKINLMNKNFETKMDEIRYKTAVEFGDKILKYGHDYYGTEVTPGMIDGINIFTMQPATYVVNGVKSVTSNFLSQQAALKTLTGVSAMTGDSKYKERAMEIIRHNLAARTDKNGFLYAGGHGNWDSFHEQPAWGKEKQFEIKEFFPYYELWYEADSERTSKFVEAMWNSLVMDWSIMNYTRHGKYNKEMSATWDSEWTNPDPWYKVQDELGFFMTGMELVYGAMSDYEYAGNTKSKEWAIRLLEMYEKAADKKTGLVPDLYQLTSWRVRDRGLDQFGEDFPEEKYGFKATEGNVQSRYLTTGLSVPTAITLYNKGLLPEKELKLFVNDHVGFATYQYDWENHQIKYLLADGTDLTGYVLKKDGYFGKAGDVLKSGRPSRGTMNSFVLLHLVSGEQILWDYARELASLYDLGDIGTKPGENVNVNLATKGAQVKDAFVMCDLYEKTGCEDYLKLAKAIMNNAMLMSKRGFFMTINENAYVNYYEDTQGWNKVYCKFDDGDALACLRIEELLEGRSGTVPRYENTMGNQLDNYDGFEQGEIGANNVIFSGQYDVDALIDKMK